MGARLRSQWKNSSIKLKIMLIIVLIVVSALVMSFIGGYFFNWTWTGFGPFIPPSSGVQREKTLYDWLQLAIVPGVLAFGVWWLSRLQQQHDQRIADRRVEREREAADNNARVERALALDNQREVAFKEYIDKLSELMLHENLRQSKPESEVRKIARVLTLIVLSRLDEDRKKGVLQFLYESGLIDKGTSIIDLWGADLSKVNLSHVNLRGASLRGASLRRATLGGANLSEADLSKTDLWGVNFNGAIGGFIDLTTIGGPEMLVFDSYDGGIEADLKGAILSEADLYGSNATKEQLEHARSLKGATMPDGSIHP